MTLTRGFTLLIAMIMMAVILSVGLALLNITYKQTLLSASAKNSNIAFYNADAALECALYWDAQDQFDYTKGLSSGQILCQGQTANYLTVVTGTYLVTTFSIPCPSDSHPGDGTATTTIYKGSNGATYLFSTGYDTCTMGDPRRTERGLQAHY